MKENNKKDRDMKDIFEDMVKLLKNVSDEYLYYECMFLDNELLSLKRSDASFFANFNHIFPGNNVFLNCISFLVIPTESKNQLSDAIMVKFSNLLDEMNKLNLKKENTLGISEMCNPQAQWQQNYYFRTYLLYLILSDSKIKYKLENFTRLSSLDISSICLFNKLILNPKIIPLLNKINLAEMDVISLLTNFLAEHLPFLVINQEDYKAKQMENIRKSNYDLFSSRMIIKDYPIIKIDDKYYMSSFFYVQNGIFSRLVYKLKNDDSKLIGETFERIIYNQFKLNYSHILKDSLNDDCIQLNPCQNGNELCDILIKKENKYLLIDCKAKEFIETIYSNNNYEIEIMKDKYNQRFKKIKDIRDGKFSNFLPNSIDIDNVYSLVAVIDDCSIFKSDLLRCHFLAIDESDKLYCEKHIDFICYDDLLEFINADVDLIKVMHRSKIDGSYNKFIKFNVKVKDKKKYSKMYYDWFAKARFNLPNMMDKILVKEE